MYSFQSLVLAFAGGESACVGKMRLEPDLTHPWPLGTCLPEIVRDGRLVKRCKQSTLQFVIIKPVFAGLSLVMLLCNSYRDPVYQWTLAIVYNLSYSVALYGLLIFYLASKNALSQYHPVLKFAAVKVGLLIFACLIF